MRDGKNVLTNEDGTVYEYNYKDGALNGPWKETRPDGTVVMGTYVNGQKEGKETIQRTGEDNVPVYIEQTYTNGKKNGPFLMVTGQATTRGEFVDDAYEGKMTIISNDGTVSESNYEGGVLNGPFRTVGPDGVSVEGQYVNGYLDGEVNTYAPNSKTPIKTEHYKDGKQVSTPEFDFGKLEFSDNFSKRNEEALKNLRNLGSQNSSIFGELGGEQLSQMLQTAGHSLQTTNLLSRLREGSQRDDSQDMIEAQNIGHARRSGRD